MTNTRTIDLYDLFITKPDGQKGRLVHMEPMKVCKAQRDGWIFNGHPDYSRATFEIIPSDDPIAHGWAKR